MSRLPVVRLKKGREKSLRNRHPWVFSGAVDRNPEGVSPGDIVDVVDSGGKWLARGTINPSSRLPVRVLTWDRGQTVDEGFIAQRLRESVARRAPRAGRRLAHLEADGLPGLIADQYADVVVVQLLTPLMERHRQTIVDTLAEVLSPASIYERSDSDVRQREGLTPRTGLLWGQEPPTEVEVEEGDGERSGVILVDVRGGQKTGFFLDQRVNRWRVARRCEGKRVLNCFSYTGGFSVAALAWGASEVVNVDVSADALETAERMGQRNGADPARFLCHKADVFEDLRRRRDAGERWDVIVLDPPKFAWSKANLDKACRGYKDINLQAMGLLAPGGVLATFSCSGLVTPPLFQSVVAGAAADAGRDVRVLEKLSQPSDHPLHLSFPESEYLKGLICRVD